jgi:hypothetical protein
MFSQSALKALRAQQPPPLPFFDRRTFEQVIEVGS